MELYGGKANVLAADLMRWLGSLWHGRRLALTVACATVVVAGGVWLLADPLPAEGPRARPATADEGLTGWRRIRAARAGRADGRHHHAAVDAIVNAANECSRRAAACAAPSTPRRAPSWPPRAPRSAAVPPARRASPRASASRPVRHPRGRARLAGRRARASPSCSRRPIARRFASPRSTRSGAWLSPRSAPGSSATRSGRRPASRWRRSGPRRPGPGRIRQVIFACFSADVFMAYRDEGIPGQP